MTQRKGAPRATQAEELRECIRALVRRFSLAERADVDCCGLTVAQAATLEALSRRDEPHPLGELGRSLGITPSTLTRNLARLEERRLVKKTADPEDARASRVALTAAGRTAAREVARQEEAFAAGILAQLPAGNAASVLDALHALLHAVRVATEGCCPGAFDHLMADGPWKKSSVTPKTNCGRNQ